MTLRAHLEGGVTTIARAWAVVRRDGRIFGFTDHDRDLAFEGITFRADTGMSARALAQSTGLAVDNTEGFGALSDAGLREADIRAGRFDGASVRIWQVNWADVAERALIFRGSIGEVGRDLVGENGAFRAELRGLAEALAEPQGLVFQRTCSAVLGDGRCRFDLRLPGFFDERAVDRVEDARAFHWAAFGGFDDRWFEKGRVEVLTGAGAGLVGVVKNDRLSAGGARRIELWQGLGAEIAPGDLLRLEPGCDKREETCRLKFDNFLNFRGFPHLPGEDWLAVFPARLQGNDGGRMAR
jgi:uncharacterized phage protein (TIGR02218 family)